MKFIPSKKTKQKKFLYQYNPAVIEKIKIPCRLLVANNKIISHSQQDVFKRGVAEVVAVLLVALQQEPDQHQLQESELR